MQKSWAVILKVLAYFCCGAIWAGCAGLIQASLVPGRLEEGTDVFLFLIFVYVVLLQPFVAFGVVAVLCIGLGGMVWQVVRAPANRKSAVGAVQEARPVNIATTTRKRRTVSYLILGLTLLCVAIVPVLVAEKVPRHIAFRQTIPRFEQALMQADHSSVSKIGRYPVKTVAQDSEGGIYFKTGDRVTGGWMDPEERITYGFAYQPDPEQSPFGEWDYRLWPIAEDWYEFKATDAF